MDSSFENSSYFLPKAESTLKLSSNNGLLVTLSTIVMLAKEKKVDEKHLICAKNFLEGVQIRQGKRNLINNSEIFLKKIRNYGKKTDDSGNVVEQTNAKNFKKDSQDVPAKPVEESPKKQTDDTADESSVEETSE